MLDIGCGSGAFLYRMKLAGWELTGSNRARVPHSWGNEHHQLNIQAGTWANARLTPESFDYIRLNHSFEHILEPQGQRCG